MNQRRNYNLKRRDDKKLPPEKLHDILSRIYPKKVVDEIFPILIKTNDVKGGAE